MTTHIDILRKGVPYWNEWRENNPDVIPDLIRADLQELDLSEVDLSKANLAGVNLRNVNLKKVDLSEANLRWVKLREANLSEANLIKTNLTGANLKKVNLTDAILPTSKMNVLQGDGVRIKTIHTETYRINIYDNRMQIGCKNHTIDEWFTFTDTEISTMADDALSFWKEWKPKLQEITQ